MWKNIVERSRPRMTIWRTHIACWMPKATNSPTECVILTAYPLQQWLQEGSSILRYIYITSLVNTLYHSRLTSGVVWRHVVWQKFSDISDEFAAFHMSHTKTYSYTPTLEAANSSEKSLNCYQFTWPHRFNNKLFLTVLVERTCGLSSSVVSSSSDNETKKDPSKMNRKPGTLQRCWVSQIGCVCVCVVGQEPRYVSDYTTASDNWQPLQIHTFPLSFERLNTLRREGVTVSPQLKKHVNLN